MPETEEALKDFSSKDDYVFQPKAFLSSCAIFVLPLLLISLKCDIDICPLEPHKQQNLAQLNSHMTCSQSTYRHKPGCCNLTPYSDANAVSQGSLVGLLASFLPVISGSLKPASLAPCSSSLVPGEKCSDCSGPSAGPGALPSLQYALPSSDFHRPLSRGLCFQGLQPGPVPHRPFCSASAHFGVLLLLITLHSLITFLPTDLFTLSECPDLD